MITLNLDWHEVLWWMQGGMAGSHLRWSVYEDMVNRVWPQCSEQERRNLWLIMRRDLGRYWRPDGWSSFDLANAHGEGDWKPLKGYTIDREDYPNFSDTEFANARASKGGRLASGVLHRSSSPFCDDINRAYYVSEYMESEKVMTVLNLADTEEKMKSYDMPPYSRQLWEEGNVILCPLKADPTADDFNKRLIAALKELPSRPAPYIVHCMEGKDRTGYVCALLEGLCGATYEEIVDDYLITYNNFFHLNPGNSPELCNTLVSLRLNTCLMYYAGVSDEAQLPNVDYAKAFSAYLLSHGMNHQQLDALIQVLTTPWNP